MNIDKFALVVNSWQGECKTKYSCIFKNLVDIPSFISRQPTPAMLKGQELLSAPDSWVSFDKKKKATVKMLEWLFCHQLPWKACMALSSWDSLTALPTCLLQFVESDLEPDVQKTGHWDIWCLTLSTKCHHALCGFVLVQRCDTYLNLSTSQRKETYLV